MIRYAFKEWAVIVHALATGQQSLILRKGGIAEEGGVFRPEHERFWLYPTYVHQQRAGVQPAMAAWFTCMPPRPPQGTLRLTHYVTVPRVYYTTDLAILEALAPWHQWSLSTVTQRFHYRTPGLYVLPVRVFALPTPLDVPDLPEYEGCKTWVDLGQEYPANATPVLSDVAFAEVLALLDERFQTSAV